MVATGIDQASLARPVSQPDVRIAELTQKLRADQLRTERPGPSARTALGGLKPARLRMRAARCAAHAEAIDNAAKAAVAAAVLPMVEDVTIRPIPPKPSLFPEQAPASAGSTAGRARLHPARAGASGRSPSRMPRFDELPRPAQAELRAQRGEQPETEHPEKRKVGLLRRLAAVGLGRRDDDEEAPLPEFKALPSSAHRLIGPLLPRRRARPWRRRARNRFPNTPSVRRIRGSTRLAARCPFITRRRRINSRFPPSCVGRRTDADARSVGHRRPPGLKPD